MSKIALALLFATLLGCDRNPNSDRDLQATLKLMFLDNVDSSCGIIEALQNEDIEQAIAIARISLESTDETLETLNELGANISPDLMILANARLALSELGDQNNAKPADNGETRRILVPGGALK